ncbi:MAG: MarR family transcriptional regulator [Clostridia bacterium]|nr:MarR family transcriptional regulator [Clostridia bacterium]
MENKYYKTVRRLCRVSMLHRYRISKALTGLNIYRGQPEILAYLIAHGDCSQKELAEHIGVSPASVATSIKRLGRAGFVERTEDENDRRINRLRITEKGRQVHSAGKSECDKTDAEMFRGFSEEEVSLFDSMLARIAENLSGGVINDEEVFEYIKNEPKGDDNDD